MTFSMWWEKGFRYMMVFWWIVILLMLMLFWIGYQQWNKENRRKKIRLLKKRYDEGDLTKQEYYHLSKQLLNP